MHFCFQDSNNFCSRPTSAIFLHAQVQFHAKYLLFDSQQTASLTLAMRFFGKYLSLRYINNSLYLAQKYPRIIVHGHYVFQNANSFPRAKLEEICELRATGNVEGQTYVHVLAHNRDYFVYYPTCVEKTFTNSFLYAVWNVKYDLINKKKISLLL